MRLKNRLLYIHPGYIVLILKILKKNVVNSLSVKTRNALVNFFFTYEGLACCHMTSTSFATTCDFIGWFFFKILFQFSRSQYTDYKGTT